MNRYDELYGIRTLDDIHNYFPAFLYDQNQFTNVQDIFRYMNRQINNYCNPYNRGLQEYSRNHIVSSSNAIPSRATNRTARYTETIDITPMFTQVLNGQNANILNQNIGTSTTAGTAGTAFLAEYILGMLQTPIAPANANAPIIPTQGQIDTATTLRAAMAVDEDNECSVCQTNYTEGQSLRTITDCEHMFHQSCIDPWFARNSQCPNCRHDIRI